MKECIIMRLGRVVDQAPTEVWFANPSYRRTADCFEGRLG